MRSTSKRKSKVKESQDKGVVLTNDPNSAEDLANKGVNVKLTKERKQDLDSQITFDPKETRLIGIAVGKSLALSVRDQGDEIHSVLLRDIQPSSFAIYIRYKNDTDSTYDFQIEDDKIIMVSSSGKIKVGQVGMKPSGEPILQKDILRNSFNKYFKSDLAENNDSKMKKQKHNTKKYLKEYNSSRFFDDKDQALAAAKEESKQGYSVHVNQTDEGGYVLDDWYDYEETVASFYNGMELNESAATDRTGKRITVGDVVEVKGKYFKAKYDPLLEAVVLQPVKSVVDQIEYSKPILNSTPLFESVIKNSYKVTEVRKKK